MENLSGGTPEDRPQNSSLEDIWNEGEWDPEFWSTWPTTLGTIDNVDVTNSIDFVNPANISTQLPDLGTWRSTYATGSDDGPPFPNIMENSEMSQFLEVSMWAEMIACNTKLSLIYR